MYFAFAQEARIKKEREAAKEVAKQQQPTNPGSASDESGDEGFGDLFGRNLRKSGNSRLR